MSGRLDIEGQPIEDGTGKNICQGCADGDIPGVRWPSAIDNDTTRPWVERCDWCERYESDVDAARAVIAAGFGINVGFGIPKGAEAAWPYIIGFGHRPEGAI